MSSAAIVETPSGKGRGDENFPVGSWLIRRDLRPHVHVFYRFAREADDVADNPGLAPEDKVRRLDRMGAVLEGAPGGDAPAAAELRASLAETGVTAQHAHDILRAFRLDATKARYRDWDDLLDYCRYSAAPVGRQLLDLHGETRATWDPSDALCNALQILNHLQDCGDDYRALDRVYLPQQELDRAGARIEDLKGRGLSPALRAVLDRLLDGTDLLIARARALPPAVRSPGLRRECAVIVGLAQRLARRLRAGDPLAMRVKLTRGDFAAAFLAGFLRGDGVSAPADLEADAARAEARETVAAAGTSFYWAMRMLPKPRREAMFAVYAFCRAIDDIADSDDGPAAKLAALSAWRAEVAAIFAGAPERPLARALLEPVAQYNLRQSDFLALIDGMEMDAREAIVAPTMTELDLYCDHVASAVGRLSVRIFGEDSPDADRVAHALGRALQLTNILRDLAEDAQRGRLYLPREPLERYGIPFGDPISTLGDPGIARVCEEVAEMAERRYSAAWGSMKHCRPGTMRPAAVMAAVYHATLVRLRRRGWSRLDKPVSVPRPMKLWLALRHGFL